MEYSKNLFASLQKIKEKYNELNDKINSADTTPQQFIETSKQIKKFVPIIELYDEYMRLIENTKQAEELAGKNDELAELARMEIADAHERLPLLEEKIKILMLPSDPNNEKNILVEMRPAAGGDEASIFVSNLFETYQIYCKKQGWKVNIMDVSMNSFGMDYIFFSVTGENVYSKMKFESGVHRVQRVPVTESKGRVHTSTITVAVMPEFEEIGEIKIDPKDLRIDVYRAGGKGGQHVNKTESAVRLTHLPTNIVVACSQERSQIENRAKAMALLISKVWQFKEDERKNAEDTMRKSQVGTGDRSEKIRTYNYPQNRITDHRINLSLNKLDIVMEGNLDEVINALIADEQKNLMENLKI